MVYTEDLKSLPLKRLWVRVPPRPPYKYDSARGLIYMNYFLLKERGSFIGTFSPQEV